MPCDRVPTRRSWRGTLLVLLLATTIGATGCGRTSTPDGPVVTSLLPAEDLLAAGGAPELPATAHPTPVTPGHVPTPDPAIIDRSARVSSYTPPRSASPRSSGTTVLPAAAPVGLRIPAIGVDSMLMDLGLEPDGTLEVPPDGFPAGWYSGSPTPGELGPAIIAGHVDWAGQPGVFFALRDLVAGDEVVITRRDGGTARFHVTRVEQFDKDAFPTEAVYGDLDHAGLRLITCGGSFDAREGSYRDNVVVFAELSASNG